MLILIIIAAAAAGYFIGVNQKRPDVKEFHFPEGEKDEIRRIRAERGNVQAVKALRVNHPGLGLAEAKGVVDKL